MYLNPKPTVVFKNGDKEVFDGVDRTRNLYSSDFLVFKYKENDVEGKVYINLDDVKYFTIVDTDNREQSIYKDTNKINELEKDINKYQEALQAIVDYVQSNAIPDVSIEQVDGQGYCVKGDGKVRVTFDVDEFIKEINKLS